jgi:GNAT superfamily N-acetyltransferase
VNPDLKVDLLGSDEPVDSYARAIARAFVGYPVMNRTFSNTPGLQEDWIFRMVSGSAVARQAGGAKIPLIRHGDRVVAGANVYLPGFQFPDSHKDWFKDFLQEAGPSAMDFFPRFISTIESIKLPEPNIYLIMIGVDPDFQGQGLGKMLIEYVMEIARGVPGCLGVGLDTEDEKNVHIYRACGFEVVQETNLDDLPIYVMWRGV